MGYTHYWSLRRDLTDDEAEGIAADTRAIVEASTVPVWGWDGTGEPTYSEPNRCFALNGGCETFAISRKEGWDFCKTRGLPYDEIVTASLLAAKARLGDAIRLSSDGDAPDWEDGRDLAFRALGHEVPRFEHERTSE